MPKGRLRTEPGDVTLVVHDPIPAPAARSPDRPRRQGAAPTRAHAIVADDRRERLQERDRVPI